MYVNRYKTCNVIYSPTVSEHSIKTTRNIQNLFQNSLIICFQFYLSASFSPQVQPRTERENLPANERGCILQCVSTFNSCQSKLCSKISFYCLFYYYLHVVQYSTYIVLSSTVQCFTRGVLSTCAGVFVLRVKPSGRHAWQAMPTNPQRVILR